MRPFLDALKALADLNRLRILLALRDRPLCVCQIVALLELAPSTVSKHLAILDQVGFIQAQKEGRWIFYRRTGRKGPVEVRWLTALVDRLASACPQAVKDRKRLAKLLQTQREVLCSRYYSPKARTVSSS